MPCILCESQEVNKLEGAQPGVYYHCRMCDLIFLEPEMRLGRDEEKSYYDEHNNTLDNPGYVAMFEKFLAAVLPHVPPGVKALDYGCGPGPVLQALLQRRGIPTDVYDPFFAPVFPVGPYGLITCTEALEHAFNPKMIWQSFLSLLQHEGILGVMTHLHKGPDMFRHWWYKREPTHVVFYGEHTFSWLARTYEFQLLFTDGNKSVVLRKI
jgi:2-polyprenyl-3-methyl-5-hydroxy-6-metoxy-1,4-benzoquinol methylase